LSAANAFYTDPAWSPDGRRIAFQCTGLVCLINADGTGTVQLTARSGASHRRPAWSPDGQRIVCAVADREFGEDLYVIKADGTGISRLTENLPPRIFDHPAWSPDGSAIAFTVVGSGMVPEIATINPDGTGLRTLLSLASPRREELVWSPDGERLAFVDHSEGNGDVFAINRNGSGLLNLSDHPAIDRSPAWAPDGERIAFLSNRGDQQSIYVAGADGSGLTQLAHEATPGHFDWAPDGQRIAFERSSEWFGGSRQVYVLRETDRALRQLTPQPGLLHHSGFPRWSPDGRKLAITSADVGVSAAVRVENLYLVDPEGSAANPDWSGVVRLTDHSGVRHTRLLWSPDGTRLAFVATRWIPGGPFSWVGMVEVASREVRDVSPVARSSTLNLSWSPDSRRLAYMSQGALYVVDSEGIETRTLISRPVIFSGQPAW
jgi:Tol biopolymer transport system component